MSYPGPSQQYPYPQQAPAPSAPPAPQTQSFLSRPMVIGGMVLGIIGGLMLLISVLTSFVSICNTSTFGLSFTICVSAGPGGASYMGVSHSMGNEFIYGYLLLVFGILVLVFGILAPVLRNRNLATMTWIFAAVGMIMAIVLLLHFMLRGPNALGYTGGSGYSISVLPSIGFFLAIIGGILGIVGGMMIGKQLHQMRQPVAPQAPMGAPYQVQPQYPQQPPPPQQPPSY